MRVTRRYQVLVDRGVCMSHGCPWHREGDTAEFYGQLHAETTGHEVRVSAGSVVIFGTSRPKVVAL